MPVIPRLADKKKSPSARKKFRQSMYSKPEYKDLRNWWMKTHPICQICEQNGLLTASQELHHVETFCDTNISQTEAYRRLMDENNYLALCKECHRRIHKTTSKEEDAAYQKRIEMAKGYSGTTY